MGNNASSHQQCPANGLPHGLPHGLSHEIGRGWTQSFPRELSRHHSQPSGPKVLPEPPNQRLRATNNGSIIHNGGTISGRRPSALTLPHDLNKQGVFRSRSTSASNIGLPRLRKGEAHCCHYQSDAHCADGEMQRLKKFGSEPDLRYSPTERSSGRHQYAGAAADGRHCNGCYPERDSRERESRYKAKKKYKAPAPPANGVADGSSPDSCRWDVGQEREARARTEEEVQPPPRRSRLFKTRAETKRAQVNWQASLSCQAQQERGESCAENERRWRCRENGARPGWREDQVRQDRWDHQNRRDEPPRRSKVFDGKNTLQRSMSSPEFQAELMQVARKVRNKLNCGRRSAVPLVESASFASLGRKLDEERKRTEKRPETRPETRVETRVETRTETRLETRPEKRSARSLETVTLEERRTDNGRPVTSGRIHDERRIVADRCKRPESKTSGLLDSSRGKEHREPRQESGAAAKRKSLEEAATSDENAANRQRDPTRKPLKERLETLGHPADRLPAEKHRRDFGDNQQRLKQDRQSSKARKLADAGGAARTRSESPVGQCGRGRFDVRGQGSGRESTPEPAAEKARDKENSDPGWRRTDARNESRNGESRWAEPVIVAEAKESKPKDKLSRKPDEKNWHILSSPEKSAPRTFYFGMDEALSKESRNSVEQQMDQLQSRIHAREISKSPDCTIDDISDGKSGMEDISLKLRPTLPKKQLEIPRFSPSAAWRLLSALEAPGPTMSTASEEIPVMFEERIERLSRPPPPPPLVALGPRSSHDKSGDSGISGDAGAANDDSLDVSTTNRMKTPATRPTWTPQQDLGEESSSDAGVDSPPPMPTSPAKFPPRAHVFSLSLPRDDNRMYIYNPEPKGKEGSVFNSLQKLKRSVSGALGLGPLELERKRTSDALDDNWLLSSSAPTSLQHNQMVEGTRGSPSDWKPGFDDDDDDGDEEDEEEDEEEEEVEEEEEEDEELSEDRTDFPMIMKPPSFSYLASGGHVMYLPESNGADYQQPRSLNFRSSGVADNEKSSSSNSVPKYRKNGVDESAANGFEGSGKRVRGTGFRRERSFVNGTGQKSRDKHSGCSKSCESVAETKQRSGSPVGEQQSLQDGKEAPSETKTPSKSGSKGRRFTFQSTVRQIERRRLAEKLSREAEAKERQRKGELEAMRKVEEEFQRKRAREKANIRQQLRLYSMDENLSSLPTVWDSSQLSRADPDGAPSSSASSPTSAPPGKSTTNRKTSVSSDEYHRKRASSSDSRHRQQLQQREYKDYRPKYYDWSPDSSSHLEYKQTTVHPKVVCDIPKSSPVFVDANVHGSKPANSSATPRSDNYRKDFAHGAVAARSSLASSDSELSQPNTRPHSRQTGNKAKLTRSRSASPERSEEVASSEDESPVEPVKQERNPINGFVLNGVQPFVREKSYRPISFNPQPPPPPIPS